MENMALNNYGYIKIGLADLSAAKRLLQQHEIDYEDEETIVRFSMNYQPTLNVVHVTSIKEATKNKFEMADKHKKLSAFARLFYGVPRKRNGKKVLAPVSEGIKKAGSAGQFNFQFKRYVDI